MRDSQIQYVLLLTVKTKLKKEEANPGPFKAGNKMTESKNDCDYSSVFFYFVMQLKCKHSVDFCFKQSSVLNWSHQPFINWNIAMERQKKLLHNTTQSKRDSCKSHYGTDPNLRLKSHSFGWKGGMLFIAEEQGDLSITITQKKWEADP